MDVYSDWIDACENVAQEAALQEKDDRDFSSYATGARGGAVSSGGVAGAREDDEEEEGGGYDDDY